MRILPEDPSPLLTVRGDYCELHGITAPPRIAGRPAAPLHFHSHAEQRECIAGVAGNLLRQVAITTEFHFFFRWSRGFHPLQYDIAAAGVGQLSPRLSEEDAKLCGKIVS